MAFQFLVFVLQLKEGSDVYAEMDRPVKTMTFSDLKQTFFLIYSDAGKVTISTVSVEHARKRFCTNRPRNYTFSTSIK